MQPAPLEVPWWYENGIVTGVRMDKWLWAARFFKTRSLAARACELGRIEANGQPAKPARDVRAGDRLQVKNDSGDFQVEVLGLSEMRGPVAVAQTLYRETEVSRELRLKLAEERKAMPHFEASREGKPSKRDRRGIDRLRGRAWRTLSGLPCPHSWGHVSFKSPTLAWGVWRRPILGHPAFKRSASAPRACS